MSQHLPRKISSNTPDPSYPTNSVKSTSTNLFTFFPVHLFHQLSNLTNIYFLVVAVLQAIPEISLTNGTPMILVPLMIVIAAVIAKDAVEEYGRYRKDKEQNERQVEVWKEGKFVYEEWENLRVGEVIKMKKGQMIPCDVLVISTSHPQQKGYTQTKGLDGERNLKQRHSFFKNTINHIKVDTRTHQMNFEVECGQPNQQLGNFQGKVHVQDLLIPLEPSNLMMRGCTLKNVEEVIGLCLYTGPDTKVVLNSAKFYPKKSHFTRKVNSLVFEIFIWQILIAITCSLLNLLLQQSYDSFTDMLEPQSFWLTVSTWFLMTVYFIPISLIVTMQMVKLFQGKTLESDPACYSMEQQCHATANNTAVNQSLGQIKYVFTDKTGTLTKNNMVFRHIVCGGVIYGEEKPQRKLSDSVRFLDYRLKHQIQDPKVQTALRILTLCHEIQVEEKDGQRKYSSSSPDQIALINFAKLQGWQLLGQSNSIIEVAEQGEKGHRVGKYEKLAFLEFNSDRKRMSVIVRNMNSGQIMLLMKGADSTVIPLLGQKNKELSQTQYHINKLSQTGLRTLILAQKPIKKEQYQKWNKQFLKAKSLIGSEKIKALTECYSQIETDLQLIGATAIEDELQQNVAETIQNMTRAGMHFYMLTGDKRQTAISIGRSSGLISHNALILDIPPLIPGEEHEWALEIRDMNKIAQEKVFLLNAQRAIPSGLPLHQTICYRCTPANKQKIVEEVLGRVEGLGLAVGDGANDVNMITTADVGVAIRGKEGTEATRVADYVLGEFDGLEALTLYFGRQWYRKNTQLALFSFWKNWLQGFCSIFFGSLTYFSNVPLFNPFINEFYNSIFTDLPIVIWAVVDQQYSPTTSKRHPHLYSPGIKGQLFNNNTFLTTALKTMVHAFIALHTTSHCLEATILTADGDTSRMQLVGAVLLGCMVVCVNLRVLFLLSHGFKVFLTISVVACTVVYWFAQWAQGQFFNKPSLEILYLQLTIPNLLFPQLFIFFKLVLVQMAIKTYQDLKTKQQLMQGQKDYLYI